MISYQKDGAADITNSKTEADAAGIARISNLTQRNYIQRASQNYRQLESGARGSTRLAFRAESGLGFAVKTEKSASRRHHSISQLFANKRSQAAMEFLMTYGWAILVVLAAIVALAYFGVMSPSKFMPESCTLPPTSGLACVDFNVFPSSAHLYVVNGGGRDLLVQNISIGSCFASFGTRVNDGQAFLFNITGCAFGSSGQKMKETIMVSYAEVSSSFEKTSSGSITASIG